MRATPVRLVLALVVGVLAMASCTSEQRGMPTPQASSSSGATHEPAPEPSSDGGGQLPAYGAPKVQNPISGTEQFQQNPCSMLTPAQLDQAGLPSEGEEKTDGDGSTCRWSDKASYASIALHWYLKNKEGLSLIYAKEDQLELFEELPSIDGNPTVAYAFSDDRDLGNCSVAVGITDELAVDVSIGQSRENRGEASPCQAAHRVAGMMLETMRGG